MGLTFRKRIRVAPGIALNLSQRGVAVSAGPRGAKLSLGAEGRIRSSVGSHGVRHTATLGSIDQPENTQPRRHWPKVIGALVGVLVFAAMISATAEAAVKPASRTLNVAAGAYASLTVKVTPTATCRITVLYKSGPSEAAGLYPKRGSLITWTWKVGTRTTAGNWPVRVDCGAAGRYATTLRVG
jgi:hypothetical protein